ncbi:MAG: hypothetical protein GF350_08945, partial [Chitinivibrionales bacterium]|nr:hypothetical protein [Chitinivibrionales bacterium]
MSTLILTTCMGRLDHLRQTFPTWQVRTPCDVAVVDHVCPDECGKELRMEHPIDGPVGRRLTVLRYPPELVETRSGQPIFNKCKALNYGLEWARMQDRYDSVLLLDADTRLHRGFWEEWGPCAGGDQFDYIVPKLETRSLTGVLLVRLQHLKAIGGFDEGMAGWGCEDLDVRLRLFLCARLTAQGHFAQGLLSAIDHDDELRTRHYASRDTQATNYHNKARMLENLRACRGWSYEDALRELRAPEVIALLVT